MPDPAARSSARRPLTSMDPTNFDVHAQPRGTSYGTKNGKLTSKETEPHCDRSG